MRLQSVFLLIRCIFSPSSFYFDLFSAAALLLLVFISSPYTQPFHTKLPLSHFFQHLCAVSAQFQCSLLSLPASSSVPSRILSCLFFLWAAALPSSISAVFSFFLISISYRECVGLACRTLIPSLLLEAEWPT